MATYQQPGAAPSTILVPRGIGLLLLIGGLIGSVASFVLTADKIHLLEDPSYVPGCSINAQFSCGSVMTSWQASLFGFPNSLIGLAAFPVVAAIGALLMGRVQIPRWAWWTLQIGVLFAIALVHWLMFQSIFEIGKLCLYCMAVWAVTIPIFWYVTLTSVLNDPSRLEGLEGLEPADPELADPELADPELADPELEGPGADHAIRLPRWHLVVPIVWLAAVAIVVITQVA